MTASLDLPQSLFLVINNRFLLICPSPFAWLLIAVFCQSAAPFVPGHQQSFSLNLLKPASLYLSFQLLTAVVISACSDISSSAQNHFQLFNHVYRFRPKWVFCCCCCCCCCCFSSSPSLMLFQSCRRKKIAVNVKLIVRRVIKSWIEDRFQP